MLPDEIPGTLSGLVWVKNDTELVYGTADENWRVHDATMHVLGTPVSKDVELYRETQDEGFRVGAGLSAQEDWLIISTGDNETSEVRLVPADDPTAEPIAAAAEGRRIRCRCAGGTLLIACGSMSISGWRPQLDKPANGPR